MGDCLIQVMSNNQERPITYERTLTANYAQVERETLAIIFGSTNAS